MKKQLLSFALAAVLAPAFNSNAQTLTEVWRYMTDEYNASWDDGVPNWTSETEIKKESCARMATARNGKMYTINMKTMAIMEITADGFKEFRKLPKLEGGDYYGTGISVDQAGNFLIGHYFTQKPNSSIVWTVYNPENETFSHHNIGVPDDLTDGVTNFTGVGRIDCVGRVVGDMTKEAAFFIAPSGSGAAYVTRCVFVGGDGDGDASKVVMDGDVFSPGSYLGSSAPQNIAQPKYDNYEDVYINNFINGFIMASEEGGSYDQWVTFNNGTVDYSISNLFKGKKLAKTKGFDTFVLEGKRYYVLNYLENNEEAAQGKYTMNIAVYDAKGYVVATWKNEQYAMSGSASGGYSSIIAEPAGDGSVNIYVYNCNTVAAAAMLNFKLGDPNDKVGTIDNPVRVKTALDLAQIGRYFDEGDIYIELENDIDMSGVKYTVPNMDEKFNKVVHFNGNNHVISNLTVSDGNASLLGNFTGEIKNLGLENVELAKQWFCVGGIAGQANNATISNCYVTGNIHGCAAGGLVGANSGAVTIENCYFSGIILDDAGGHVGGLVGRADADLTINYAYANAPIDAKGIAGGVVAVRNSNSVSLNNVIVWNPSIDSEASADAVCVAVPEKADFQPVKNNVLVWSEMTVNGEPVSGGTSHEVLIATATAWPAFSKETVDGFPVLAWQNGETGGVAEIEIEEGNAAPVYYNLQGVQVANPEGGIYIVRRGNKVTKEYIR